MFVFAEIEEESFYILMVQNNYVKTQTKEKQNRYDRRHIFPLVVKALGMFLSLEITEMTPPPPPPPKANVFFSFFLSNG